MKKFFGAVLLCCLFLLPAGYAGLSVYAAGKPDVHTAPGGARVWVYDLPSLRLKLPRPWRYKLEYYRSYNILDKKGRSVGEISCEGYSWDFKFENDFQPNHSSVAKTEKLRTPAGTYSLYTCDCDNGTAASGIKGTHYQYYAVLPVKKKTYLELEFSRHNKKPQTKKEFVSLLKGLTLKL